MKLADFTMLAGSGERDRLLDTLRVFNATGTDYPRERTVHALFAAEAARAPEAVAAFHGERSWTYREADQASNRVARLLVGEGLPVEMPVAVLVDKTFEMVASLLGVLKAGCAYVPLESSAPLERLRHVLEETGAPVLVTEKRHIRLANRLQWVCPRLRLLICTDSDNVQAESEGRGDLMREEVWDEVGRTTFDDISGGGWTSSFTGEWLSRAVMDEYGDNALAKLTPYLSPTTRVLEIACASGITMFRVAPRVAHYCGTDLSSEILRWSEGERQRRGLDNIALHHLPAHDVHRLAERDFDVVILNSVIQCFSGHNYLRDVLRKAIALMRPQGVLFLGNLLDQDRKDEFIAVLEAFRREHAGKGYRVKVDKSEELFVSRAFLDDLRHDFPEIAEIVCTPMLGSERSELSEFGYDALIRIDKDAPQNPSGERPRRQLDRRAIEAIAPSPLPERTGPQGLAYVIYTSGTSGRPKGVMVEHRGIVRLVRNTSFIALGPDDRCLQTGSLAFDASTFEIWGALLNGGAISRPPERAVLDAAELRRLLSHHGITTLWLTTGLFNQHADADIALFGGLRYVLFGGELASPAHIAAVRQAHPQLALIHAYGPTENTTFSTCQRVDDVAANVSIGPPIANSQVWVVDPAGEPVPVGVAGEICVAGDGLARGYANDPALTAAKFVPNPFAPGERMYRSGDLGRWTAAGTLEFMGRLDNQVKIRGFRVEPAEIEARLREQHDVREAIVVARECGGGHGRELLAYVTGPEAMDTEDLRDRLRRVLPDYMIPEYITQLERLPLSVVTGKVDRRALPEPAGRERGRRVPFVPPRSETERALVGIWEETLGQQGLGIDDDFFESGGHSLKVARVMDLVRKRLGVAVPLTVLFRTPTVRALADALLDLARFGVDEIDQPLIRLGGPPGAPPMFAFPPGTGDAAGFIQVAQAMTNCSFYAFNFIAAPTRLRDYADLVRSVDPSGPYIFFGYSSGGNLAYHVAGEIERGGGRVADIVMADSARKVARTPFAPGEVQRIADEFLGHESIRQLLATPVLRERAYRLIESSYAWIADATDVYPVSSRVHVLKAEDSALEYRDEGGALLASIDGWREVAGDGLELYAADGDHNHMLYQPHLERNAEIIRDIVGRALVRRGAVAGGLQ